MTRKIFDAIIIGGSYAGLSAAMALGRSQRDVLVVDSGKPCNRQTPHSHNFLTHDGEEPRIIAEKARAQVLAYPNVQIVDRLAAKCTRNDDGFTILTDSEQIFTTRKLILASGIKDLMPDIEGFSECWGISVIHCPYCHGYEFRGQKTGILANGEKAFHLASLVKNLTDQITIMTSGGPEFTAEQMVKLERNNIKILENEVSAIEHENGHLRNVILQDCGKLDFKAVYAPIPFEQHSDIPTSLGCELTEHGYIKIDEFQQTTIDGVYACGDNSAMMRSVANAVYSGNLTGAMVNKALTDERF